MPKRIVLCCDGTWNTPDQDAPTNVTRLANAVADADDAGTRQLVYYHRGVGTSRWDRLRGGALGVGLSRNVTDTYRFLVEHFEPDDEIFLFGFSRGAFTARSTAGLIRNAGVLRREHEDRIPQAYALYRDRRHTPRGVEARLFRRSYANPTRIRCIGVWDTVGALGIPSRGLPWASLVNERWAFHDTELSTTVDAAFHALAIDERRGPFEPTLWHQRADAPREQVLEQVWFAGVHCDVGGGYAESGLSDVALGWMMGRAAACGLAFRPDAFAAPGTPGAEDEGAFPFAPDPHGQAHDTFTGLYRRLPPCDRRLGEAPGGHEAVASSVVARRERDPSYGGQALVAYLEGAPVVADVG